MNKLALFNYPARPANAVTWFMGKFALVVATGKSRYAGFVQFALLEAEALVLIEESQV